MVSEIYFFSGTGNSYYIAKKLKNSLENGKLHSISSFDLSGEVTSGGDIVGIVFPVYSMDMPRIVEEFLKKVKIKKGAYVFLYENKGAESGNALYYGSEILKNRGIKVANTFSTVMPNNCILLADSEEKIPKILEKAEESIGENLGLIKRKITKPVPKKKSLYGVMAKVSDKVTKGIFGFNHMKVDYNKCTG